MEALDYESVTVFDHPEFGSISDTALDRIEKSNGFVVLLGPSKKPEEGQAAFDLATWPNDEAKIALSHRKPVALIVHEGCELSGFGAADQAAARFDFWKPESFLDNVHHVVKHLCDLKRRVERIGEGPKQPFYYKKVIMRDQIQSDGSLVVRFNHEAIVQEPRASVAHELDTGADLTPEAKLPPTQELNYQIVLKASGVSREATIEWGQRTDHSIKYRVQVDLPLEAGDEFSYSRRFRLPVSRFPLTRRELSQRSRQPGYPEPFRPISYGDCFDVTAEIKELTLALHFPANVRVKNARALVVETDTRTENKSQTEKCQTRVKCFQDDETMDSVLELKVQDPLMNHSYYILYEPQD